MSTDLNPADIPNYFIFLGAYGPLGQFVKAVTNPSS